MIPYDPTGLYIFLAVLTGLALLCLLMKDEI